MNLLKIPIIKNKPKTINIDTLYPHEIVGTYISQYLANRFELDNIKSIEVDEITELQWCNYTNSVNDMIAVLNNPEYNFIPMIDISASMFMYDARPVSIALSLGILLSQMSGGFMKNKAMTFSGIPIMYDITGETLNEKVNCIFNELERPEYDHGSMHNTNFISAFEHLLDYCVWYNISNDDVKKIKIIALSDMEFDKCCVKKNYDDSIEMIRNNLKIMVTQKYPIDILESHRNVGYTQFHEHQRSLFKWI